MAIKRCPYCKAIIDQEEKYCNNCGTQLLFPEDEFIEEEIPGEKITEEEFEEEEGKEAEEEERVEEKEKEEAEEEIKEEVKEEKIELKTPGSIPEQMPEEEKEELRFKTKDLEEKIASPSTEEKEEIERILASIREEQEEKKAPAPKEKTPSPREIIKERILKVESELPPWVEKMKEILPPEVPEGEEKIREKTFEIKADLLRKDEEEDKETREMEMPKVDTGTGLPEIIEQKRLPFDQEIEEKWGEREMEGVPSRLSSKLKAKAFDILCVTAFWLVSILLASRVLAVSLFQLFSASALSLLTFYLILAATYFFLFLFFLGETLGDWIFSKEA